MQVIWMLLSSYKRLYDYDSICLIGNKHNSSIFIHTTVFSSNMAWSVIPPTRRSTAMDFGSRLKLASSRELPQSAQFSQFHFFWQQNVTFSLRNFIILIIVICFVNKKILTTLANALVVSHLDYCNSLFASLTKWELNRLQRVQNTQLRQHPFTKLY